MIKLSKKQFDALCLCRDPMLRVMSKELEWFSDENKTVIASIVHDFTDDDYGYVVLGRDSKKIFRCIHLNTSYSTIGKAREALYLTMEKYETEGQKLYPQGDEKQILNELFVPIVPDEKLHPMFKILLNESRFEAARNIIREIVYSYTDPDGNYIKDFQTTGFNARLWELYLYMYLYDAGFHLIHDHAAPDFHCSYYGDEVFIEATTVNPSQDEQRPDLPPPEKYEETLARCDDYMPIKFGSSLYSKLNKRYWEREHVQGKPLIIAVHDFHAEGSMTWSRTALSDYLYGLRVRLDAGEDGKPKPIFEKVEKHRWNGKEIPSGFFNLKDAEYISAVLFSNAATLPKFNRMGKLAGLGSESIKMVRTGVLFNPDPKALTPIPFSMDVDSPDYEESWSDSLVMYHNPKAINPVNPDWFGDISHLWYDDVNGYTGFIQPFDVLTSFTLTLCPTQEKQLNDG